MYAVWDVFTITFSNGYNLINSAGYGVGSWSGSSSVTLSKSGVLKLQLYAVAGYSSSECGGSSSFSAGQGSIKITKITDVDGNSVKFK